jgi:hypothetical protein
MKCEVRSEPDETERPVRSGTTPDNSGSDVAPYVRMPSVRMGAVVALAIAAGVVAWLLVRGEDNSRSSKRATAQAVSAEDLTALPATVHHPVYWAGPKPGFTYELTRTSSGLIFIRYLPNGVPVGP